MRQKVLLSALLRAFEALRSAGHEEVTKFALSEWITRQPEFWPWRERRRRWLAKIGVNLTQFPSKYCLLAPLTVPLARLEGEGRVTSRFSLDGSSRLRLYRLND